MDVAVRRRTLSGDDGGAAPPLWLILGRAAGLGVVMGAVLGAAQASVLRAHVRHPWRWVGANAAAWAPAMVVIFLGATARGPDWPATVVVALGTVTGLLAGSVLGLVTWWFLPSLDGSPTRDRVVVGLLGSPVHRMLDGPLLVLRVRGTMTGRIFELPGQYADARRWRRLDIPPDSMLVLIRPAAFIPTAGRTPPSPPDAG